MTGIYTLKSKQQNKFRKETVYQYHAVVDREYCTSCLAKGITNKLIALEPTITIRIIPETACERNARTKDLHNKVIAKITV